jgi:hypothetical protein
LHIERGNSWNPPSFLTANDLHVLPASGGFQEKRLICIDFHTSRAEPVRRSMCPPRFTLWHKLAQVCPTAAPGHQTRHDAIRQVQRYDQTADFDRLLLG